MDKTALPLSIEEIFLQSSKSNDTAKVEPDEDLMLYDAKFYIFYF